jgi:hypothetical protein
MILQIGAKHPPYFGYDMIIDGVRYKNPLIHGDTKVDKKDLL